MSALNDPVCLLGGWAVYYTVNDNYQKTTGRNYIGSRDIDLGFHIDNGWNKEQLEKSGFAKAIRNLEKSGFRSISFRLFKEFNIDNGQELEPDESTKLPLHQIFQLYIDPIVDNIHPEIKNILGFVPIDEPLLGQVFQENENIVITFFERAIMLPKPHVLLAMKLNSAPKRDKEHKLIKDIADIYVLSWFSDVSLPQLKNQLFSLCSKDKVKQTIRNFDKLDISRASSLLGVKPEEVSRVLAEFT